MSKADQVLYEQLKDLLDANLEPIRKDIKQINYSLNGNGQPGLIQKVARLENRQYYLMGGLAVIGIILKALKIL